MAAPDIAGGSPVGTPTVPSIITPADISASGLVAHYKFDGNLEDSSGNGYHLQVLAGWASYIGQGPGGRQALYLQGTTYLKLANPAHDAAFRILGDLTVIALIRPVGSAIGIIATVGSLTAGSADDNIPWSLYRGSESADAYRGGLFANYQHGTGSNNLIYAKATPAGREWELIGWTRAVGANAVSELVISGYDAIAAPHSSSNIPTGGANSILTVGATTAGASFFAGYMADLMIFSAAAPAATIKAAAYTAGVRR